ncbi:MULTISPECIES: hypothetical protein [unclassified Oceanispirochaeta]|uniref:hypothetical protein n=1 Tax=unclassified Oceanispirochaeta TaxID=2635722 RepID=UPI000E09A1F5|nr:MULTISPECIES: hypothetical protein [unclassified Oceanispirochaeta]MBF9018468.1 hypothetical protein [Oceanispirochaeta sp. M2]NPD74874.1 hypothetical protein [Oceanispirochaeta sp. M1]RDG29262.1 hypothetical protein DV872_22515 [Oceanispirochaeta sp. M1]
MQKLKPGDIVTLSPRGKNSLKNGEFPSIIAALYANIEEGGAEILRVRENQLRVKILNEGCPATLCPENNFGIAAESVEILKKG